MKNLHGLKLSAEELNRLKGFNGQKFGLDIKKKEDTVEDMIREWNRGRIEHSI